YENAATNITVKVLIHIRIIANCINQKRSAAELIERQQARFGGGPLDCQWRLGDLSDCRIRSNARLGIIKGSGQGIEQACLSKIVSAWENTDLFLGAPIRPIISGCTVKIGTNLIGPERHIVGR